MSNVVYYMSMSLDGFVTAADITPEELLGAGGERLHEWSANPRGMAPHERAVHRTGAIITGRRTYDDSGWGPDGPTGSARVPTFVLTHRESPPQPAIPTPNATHLHYRVRA